MFSYKPLVLVVFCIATAAGLGQNLKTILSTLNEKCDQGETSCSSAGGVKCCSEPMAVCCDGGLSCCPFGFVCDKESNSCKSKYGQTKQLPTTDSQLSTKKVPMPTNSSCTTKQCDSDATCCHDDWDCCPFPEAICCKDKGHCCPHGYICDDQPFICRWPDDGHRIKSTSYKQKVNSATVKCDDDFECPDKNTCCMMPDGNWGCCPVESATCCDDHIHCCSKGTKCDTKHGRCVSNSGLLVLPWVTKKSATKRVSAPIKENKCDDSHSCDSEYTCCKLETGEWGCCPVPNAQCCEDHKHCCPDGWTCQAGSGSCSRGMATIPWLNKESAITKADTVESVQCDSTHYCPSGNTCCRLSSGQWGCCPVPNAVCCSDHQHCCPSGYTCQTGTGQCTRELSSIPWLNKESAITKADTVESVQCDSTHYCPSGNTCCRLSSGQWGCCPVPNAVCCSDHQHCCPSGYTCQTGTGRCTRELSSIPWLNKESAITKADTVESVQCDSTHYCPSGNTCCKLSSGQWGCCPVPNAVCCSDHQHCCPSGYTCQTGTGRCTRELSSIPWLNKESAITKADTVESVQCDSTHYCPSGNTCCRLSSGQWGCCPVPNAVCCSDHQHCCPSGYTCQTGTGECTRGLSSIPWLNKESAITKADTVESVQCDSTHYCPSGNTCCRLPSGQWGCCPVPNAVCCSDHQHCCPSGYTCQTGTGRCARGLSSIPWLNKESAITKAGTVESVQCDSTHYCPSGNTCCKLSSGQWGCCPVPNAVCCSDHQHCCPSGYTCQTGTGECTRGLSSIPWLNKESAITKAGTVENVQCDSTHYCPSGNTCCRLSSGQWGCCPVPNAVCCSDHQHCCPSGYTCQTGTGRCARGLSSIPWLNKESAITKAGTVESVQCDSTHYCPSGNTCCKLSSGQWGCCPVPNAVCCSDHQHCCPSGYTCQTGTGECTRGLSSIPWLNKESAITKAGTVENVQCDSTHYCPSGNTCCRLSSGQWGCCPVPNAVCCSDHQHCCPSGYTCQTGTGRCARGLSSIPWLNKESAIIKADTVENVRCDSTHYCPSGNTCCRLSSGQWGCCPVPNAVCCSDHQHCCPSGYTCQTGTGRCARGLSSIPWLNKESAITKADTVENVQCDSTHYCPSGNTCCRLSSGQWGCCPVPNAVCCSDHQHCCPSGYTCQTGTGQCTRGLSSIPWLNKGSAITKADTVESVQCDSTHYCPSGNTCCRLSSGQWGCCPVPNAVCCSDHQHCCPSGYTCQTGTGECTRGFDVISWMNKVPASIKPVPTPSSLSAPNSVRCNDQYECPDGYTCCPMSGGGWGCCPYMQAVCCGDGLHCCPGGYRCDSTQSRCVRGNQDKMSFKMLFAATDRQ